jgi:hypothetical protein
MVLMELFHKYKDVKCCIFLKRVNRGPPWVFIDVKKTQNQNFFVTGPHFEIHTRFRDSLLTYQDP